MRSSISKGDKNEELRRENEELRCQTQNRIGGDWYSNSMLVPEPPLAQRSQQLPQGPRPVQHILRNRRLTSRTESSLTRALGFTSQN